VEKGVERKWGKFVSLAPLSQKGKRKWLWGEGAEKKLGMFVSLAFSVSQGRGGEKSGRNRA